MQGGVQSTGQALDCQVDKHLQLPWAVSEGTQTVERCNLNDAIEATEEQQDLDRRRYVILRLKRRDEVPPLCPRGAFELTESQCRPDKEGEGTLRQNANLVIPAYVSLDANGSRNWQILPDSDRQMSKVNGNDFIQS